MRKVYLIAIAILAIAVGGCSNQSSNNDTIDAAEEERRTSEEEAWKQYYTEGEYDKYNSFASENGLAYTLIWVEGEVQEAVNFSDATRVALNDTMGNMWYFDITNPNYDKLVKGDSIVAYGAYTGSTVEGYVPVSEMTRYIINSETIDIMYNGITNYELYEGYTLEELKAMYGIEYEKGLQITSEQAIDAVKDIIDFNDVIKFTLEDKSVAEYITSETGGVKMLVYYKENAEYASVIQYVIGDVQSAPANAEKCIEATMELLPESVLKGTHQDEVEHDNQVAYVLSFSADFDYQKLPINLTDLSTDDFFADEERSQKYKELFSSYRYRELYEYLNSYLEEGDIQDHDPAYQAVEVLAPVLEQIDQCTIEHDEFAGKYTLYYGNVQEIDGNYCMIPFKENDSANFSLKVGFKKPGWLFFDEISLKLDSEEMIKEYYKSYNVNTEVISGSTIYEWVNMNPNNDKLEALAQSDNTVIQFENSDNGEVYDHQLTGEELQALKTMYSLYKVNYTLSNMASRWRR